MSGFLTSWATPAAIRPSESSFSDWISCSCVTRSLAWYRRTSPNQPAPSAIEMYGATTNSMRKGPPTDTAKYTGKR